MNDTCMTSKLVSQVLEYLSEVTYTYIFTQISVRVLGKAQ